MARVGLHGRIQSAATWLEAIPVLEWLLDQIENTLNGQLDDTNMTPKGITGASIADATITAAKLAAASVTPVVISGGIAQFATGLYTGDGTTANRVIALTFTPSYVLVLRTDATSITFESIASVGDTRSWMRSVTGAFTSDTTNWQGITSLGFKLGSNAAGTSNAAAVVYSYLAIG